MTNVNDEINERIRQRAERAERERAAREELAKRRRHGLARRHANKLQYLNEEETGGDAT